MELILDTADLAAVKELNELVTVSGVTTNPTIITKSGLLPEEVLEGLNRILSEDQTIFVQVVRTDYEGILEEARKIVSFRKNMCVKIPVTRNGLKAIKTLSAEGVRILATAIYSPAQGFLAAQNGAEYLAPYTNRMCNYGDGVKEVIALHNMLKANNMKTEVLAASFKNVGQVSALIESGIGAVTVPPEIVYEMIGHPATTIAVGEFSINWNKAYGRNGFYE